MKITEEYSNDPVDLIHVKSAQYIGDFAIRVLFSDGYKKLVDFKPFLENSIHTSIRKYLNEKKFIDYQLIDGNLNWNNFDLIFPIEDLYKGNI